MRNAAHNGAAPSVLFVVANALRFLAYADKKGAE